MEDQYPNQPEGTDVYDEPSDDDLKRIEENPSVCRREFSVGGAGLEPATAWV